MKKLLALVAASLLLAACGETFEPTKLTADRDLQPTLDLYLLNAPTKGHLDELETLAFVDNLPEGENSRCEVIKRVEYVGGEPVNSFPVRAVTVRRVPGLTYVMKAEVARALAECLHDATPTDGEFDVLNPNRGGDEAFWRANLQERIRMMFSLSRP